MRLRYLILGGAMVAWFMIGLPRMLEPLGKQVLCRLSPARAACGRGDMLSRRACRAPPRPTTPPEGRASPVAVTTPPACGPATGTTFRTASRRPTARGCTTSLTSAATTAPLIRTRTLTRTRLDGAAPRGAPCGGLCRHGGLLAAQLHDTYMYIIHMRRAGCT